MTRIIEAAYGTQRPRRRVLLLVNPIGGKGKAKSLVDSVAIPIFTAAGCPLEVIGEWGINVLISLLG